MSDIDAWDGTTSEGNTDVHYHWAAVRGGTGGGGSASGGNGEWSWQEGQETRRGTSAPTRTATWTAPADITENTTFTLQCTLDDAAGAIAAGETGERDDEEVVREVTVNVTPYGVQFGGQLIQGNTVLRACAGGVDDHDAQDPNPIPAERNHFQYRAHTRQVDITVTLNAQPLANAPVILQFEGNQGHDYGNGIAPKTAKLHNVAEPFDASHPWVESLAVTTDSQGRASVWVLSSDVISQPKLQVMRQPDPNQPARKIGEIECDFAPSISFRNFTNPVDPDETEDFGWIFDFPNLVNPANDSQSTPAKVYLKFKVDPDQAGDYVFVDANGDRRGNWQFVNGHELLLRIASVEVADAQTGQVSEIKGTPQELKRYAVIVNSANGPVNADEVTARRTTTAKGETAPQAHVFGGTDIDRVSTIYVEAEDQTEWSH